MNAASSNPALSTQTGWDDYDLMLIKILGACLGVILVVSTCTRATSFTGRGGKGEKQGKRQEKIDGGKTIHL